MFQGGFFGFKRLSDILYLRHLSWAPLDYGSIIDRILQQLAIFILQSGKYTRSDIVLLSSVFFKKGPCNLFNTVV